MAYVIAVVNQKGGVGKTTTSINLAKAFQLMGKTVAIVDSDAQGSVRNWKVKDEDNDMPVFAIDRPTIHKDVQALDVDIVIIDGAPSLEQISLSAIKAADLIVIPVQPSPLDLWATPDFLDRVKQRIELTDDKLKAVFLISRTIKNSSFAKEIREVLAHYELPILKQSITQYVDYAKSIAMGKTIHDDPWKKTNAATESWNIAEEIMNTYIDPKENA